MNKSIHYWILIYSAVTFLIPLLSFSVFPLLPSLFSFLSLSLGSMPSPAVCSAPTVRAQGRPGAQLARHCGASRQAHGGPPAPASSFANMPRCGAWWLGLWCVCVCVWGGGGGVLAGGDIKGGYSHWSCVNTECMGVFVAWGWGGGRSQQLLAHCNHIVGKLLTFCQAVRLAHRQMLRGWRRAFI